MPSAGDHHRSATLAAGVSGDGSDEATDSEDLGAFDRNRRWSSSSGGSEESRRMFQKLWTDADEMKVLQGFYEFTSRRGTTHANYQHDTGPFFDDIRTRLQFQFNKNQIVEKLRRLKKKYRNAVARIGSGKGSVFKSPHDRATYEISRKIWSSTWKRKPRNPPHSETPLTYPDQTLAVSCGSESAVVQVAVAESSARVPHGIPILVSSLSGPPQPTHSPPPPPLQAPATKTGHTVEEDALRICLAPLFKELLQSALDGATTAGAVAPPLWVLTALTAAEASGKKDERWRLQQILELELYLKRLELVEESVRSALEKLRSMGS
ncbi:probable transcription factor At3g04930 [Phalaenopsis equestris]|uniref:probable transcription factor At3g04930 n=1 Tax=Phalaenopsis equestris TaxID=78828 RepID=UPI0009E2BA2E|nr:probable transcription factor At3g04930 [Phalaenopsis equestris]